MKNNNSQTNFPNKFKGKNSPTRTFTSQGHIQMMVCYDLLGFTPGVQE